MVETEVQPEPQSADAVSVAHGASCAWPGPSPGGVLQALRAPALAALTATLAGCPAPEPFNPDGPMPVLPENLKRLLARTSFGINREEALRALELGYAAYLEYQLDHLAINDAPANAQLARFRTLDDSPRARWRALEGGDTTSIYEFYAATFLRGAYSRRQLFERMVEFWSDHFNIHFEAEAQQIVKPIDDAEVIRRHALGRFPDLLRASAASPAMLLYLNNASSRVGAPNQNYARELMELHTLGVDNFSQTDVEEVARALTGWSLDFNIDAATFGSFKFYTEWHDFDEKEILGKRFPAGRGLVEGEEVLDLLSLDPDVAPTTARFISRKMAVHFWGYSPPATLVEEMAAAYLDTGGDIKSMLRVVLREDWLMQAPPKLKRPYHYAISALRARPGKINRYDELAYIIGTMEHLPFHWSPPNGYPDSLAYWGSYLMPRWVYGIWLVYQDGAVELDWTPYREAPDLAQFLDRLDGDFFLHAMPQEHRAALENFLDPDPANFFRRVEALSLAIGSAEFQWY